MSTKRKPDRRIERTRGMLGDALIALIEERGYDDITIQDIADRANISRATFYLHYRDKDELLTDRLAAVYAEIVESMNLTLTLEDMRWNGQSPAITTFTHTQAHRRLYHALRQSRNSNLAIDQLTGVMAQLIEAMIVRNYGPQPDLPVPLAVICQNMAAALHGLCAWWISTDTPYSAEQMAEMFYTLNMPPVLAMLKQPDTA